MIFAAAGNVEKTQLIAASYVAIFQHVSRAACPNRDSGSRRRNLILWFRPQAEPSYQRFHSYGVSLRSVAETAVSFDNGKHAFRVGN
jgi:hypothetical protein